MRNLILSIIGTWINLLWLPFVALSFTGTWTQGSLDSWMYSIIGCTVCAAISLVCLMLSINSTGMAMVVREAAPPVVFAPLLLTIQHAFETFIEGNHLCGMEFNFIESDSLFCSFYYPWLWLMALVITAVALYPIFKSWNSDSGRY